jgi:hypothetical protein
MSAEHKASGLCTQESPRPLGPLWPRLYQYSKLVTWGFQQREPTKTRTANKNAKPGIKLTHSQHFMAGFNNSPQPVSHTFKEK